jgi:hypothetical protein
VADRERAVRRTRFLEWAREVYLLARRLHRARPGFEFLASAYECGASEREALRIWQDVPDRFRAAERGEEVTR